MQKYKLMLILPFVILVIIALGNLSSGNEEEDLLAQQETLIEEADAFAADQIYTRASERLKQAIALNVGDIDGIEAKLCEYYIADENYNDWLSLVAKRMSKASASEAEIVSAIEYYRDEKKYDKMLSTIDSGLELYPDSQKMVEIRDSLIYSYSYSDLKYDDAAPAFDGKRAVSKDGKWGYSLSNSGSQFEFDYDKAVSFCEDMAAVYSSGQAIMIDDNMKRYSVCHDNTVDGVFIYDGNMAVLTAGSKYVLCDKEMEIVGEPYDFIGTIADGLRPVQTGDKWMFLDEKGKKTDLDGYDGIALNDRYEAFFNKIAFVSENGSYKMIGTDGEPINDAVFEDAYPFMEKNSYAAVKQNNKWGFANEKGEIVIPCQYDEAKSFSYGLAAVKTGDKWGYIDRNGKIIIPAEYLSAEPFRDSQALVKSDDGLGSILLDYYK